MTRKEKALVMGFIEYLQGVYGDDGQEQLAPGTPANSLLVPLFVGSDEELMSGGMEFAAAANAMAGPVDTGSLLSTIDGLTGFAPVDDPMMGMMG
jgi:hypothetical protein